MNMYSHKECRRYGVKLCQSLKCPSLTRNYPPGIHGQRGFGRLTEYGKQLAEKQKAKVLYNLREAQFKKYYLEAKAKQGDTGEILLQFLESRLDNVIYRVGLAPTRAAARQMVNHGFFFVNGKKLNIPSYRVKVKDEITIKPSKAPSKAFESIEKILEKVELPSWISFDIQAKKARVTNAPVAEEAEKSFNPRQIVELYSK